MIIYEAWMDYLEYYPEEDEEGFDGEHFGGVKGIKEDAPQWAKDEFKKNKKEFLEDDK